jgi:hypothetical protein
VTNNENKIMDEVCYPRIEKIIKGYNFSGKSTDVLYEENLTVSSLKNTDALLGEIKEIEDNNKNTKHYDKITKEIVDNKIVVYGEKDTKGKKEGLGNSVKYYKTSFVGKHNILDADDKDKIQLAHHAGEMLAIAENTLNLVKKNDYWQLFENENRITAVYFREEQNEIDDFIKEVLKLKKPVTVYMFSWEEKIDIYDFEDNRNISLKTIPQPILEIYKQIYNII